MENRVDQIRAGIDFRWALFCVSVVAVCWFAARPFVELPFADDFSYTFTAKHLAETGRFTYNGWAAMIIGPQAYWGAAFIKLFGFSFTLMRVSMLPVAAGCAVAGYALARRCGLRPALAALSSLTLCTSPLFLPLAASFMTDVPGLFFILCALYAMVSAGLSPSRRGALLWLLAFAILAIAGGAVRQIVWVTGLAGIPCVALARRKDRVVLAGAIVAWGCVVLGVVLILRWAARQPYFIPDDSIRSAFRQSLHTPVRFLGNAAGLLFKLTMLVLPVCFAVLLGGWRRVRAWQWGVAGFAVVLAMVVRHTFRSIPGAPWIGNTLTPWGVGDWGGGGYGRPEVLPVKAWLAISLICYGLVAMAIAIVIAECVNAIRRYSWREGQQWINDLSPAAWCTLSLVIFACGYFALVLPRCAINEAYDRYLLPLYPAATIPLLLLYQSWEIRNRPRAPRVAWATWAAFALFGVAITFELYSMNRAQVRAIDQLLASGVPRRHIDGGFEFSFWTQLQLQGYFNDPRLTNPPGAYDPSRKFLSALDRRYRVVFADYALKPGESFTQDPAIPYSRPFPPFSKSLRVMRMNESARR